MASASVERLKDQIQSMKNSKARARLARKGEALTHTVIAGASGFAIGRLEKGGTPMPTMFGLDPKLFIGIGAHFLSTTAGGKFGDFMSALGDGAISAYGYAEGKGMSTQGVMGADVIENV